MPNEQQQYLSHISAIRQDASSPSAATVRSLDDLLERFPSLAPKDDSPILGRRPSLSPDAAGNPKADPSEKDLAQLSQSIHEAPSPYYTPNPISDRSRVTTSQNPRLPPMPVANDSPIIHRTYSARELHSSNRKQQPRDDVQLVDADADADLQMRSRAFTTSLIPPNLPYAPSRTNSGSKAHNLSLYATPTFVTTGETVSTPPLPDLPDPNTFSDPYPHFHRAPSRHNGMTPPISLFSEGSSSASTRSSLAYNSVYLRSSEGHDGTSTSEDFLHRRGTIASHYTADTSFGSHEGDMSLGDLDSGDVGLATTSDEVVHLTHSSSTASFASGSRARTALPASESARWSDTSYGRGMSMSETNLRPQTSHEWENIAEEEREDGTTDDEASFVDDDEDDDNMDDDDDGNNADNDLTAAVLVYEEGLGDIVHGEGISVDRIAVRSGSTHMLLSGSTTPNQMPSFLAAHLPGLANTLLALDISCNILPALPPALASCIVLEELNVSANPLRVLPTWLSQLTSLRLLIADSTGITNIPQSFHALTSLHTLSIRKNRLYSLPAWLCHLTALETLYVDGNPFLEPWSSLIAPILDTANTPSNIHPPPIPGSSTLPPSIATPSTLEDSDEPPQSNNPFPPTPNLDVEAGEKSPLRRSFSSPQSRRPNVDSGYGTPSVSRPPSTATPGPFFSPVSPRSRSGSTTASNPSSSVLNARSRVEAVPTSPALSSAQAKSAIVGSFLQSLDSTLPGDDEPRVKDKSKTSSKGSITTASSKPAMRRMKSADELSRMGGTMRPTVSQPGPPMEDRRFESMPRGGPVGSRTGNERSRVPLTVFADASTPNGRRPPPISDSRPASVVSRPSSRAIKLDDPVSPIDDPNSKEGKRTWGFLKKMSMGRMRSTSSPRDQQNFSGSHSPRHGVVRAHTTAGRTASPLPVLSPMPSPGLVNGRPEAVHAHSAPAVPIVSEDGVLMPPMSASSQNPLFASHASLPTITTPVLEEEEPQAEDTPPLPAKSPLQRNASREALAQLGTLQLPVQVPLGQPIRTPSPASPNPPTSLSMRAHRRRSFLPLNSSPVSQFDIPVPSPGPFLPDGVSTPSEADSEQKRNSETEQSQYLIAVSAAAREEEEHRARMQAEAYKRGLRSIMAYLRDLSDLSGALVVPDPSSAPSSPSTDPNSRRRPTLISEGSTGGGSSHSSGLHKKASTVSLAGAAMSVSTAESGGSNGVEERKYKEDKHKRVHVIKEIVKTERTYVKQLQELVDLYVIPSAAPVSNTFGQNSKETMIPLPERRIVFHGLESLHKFHRETLLPSFERAITPLKEADDDHLGDVSSSVASQLAMAFVSHAAFMKMYTTYINNFDNCVARTQQWVTKPVAPTGTSTPAAGAASIIGMGLSMSVVAGVAPEPTGNVPTLTSTQRKRIKHFLKKQKADPRHSQISLEGYLLLLVQRVPRYKLMLEDLVKCTPPKNVAFEDPLEVALNVISALASGMNEGKRETESRQKLLHWQKRIRGRFPSPLVQPHRRLVMDGRLLLSRVVRKSQTFAEIYKGDGEKTLVQVDCLTPELTPRPLVGLLCNDLLVLCKDPSGGENPNTTFDLWAVLRMQTVAQPASVVHGNTLRVVDNKAVLYFEAASTSEALTWTRAINTHIPASR